MNNVVTLNQLLNVGNAIQDNATKNEQYNELLDDYICKQYDIISNNEKLEKLFSSFKSARYLYDFPLEENVSISPSYEYKESFTQRSTTSQIENAVQRYIDKQMLTTDIYYSIMKVSYKLTNDEVVYLINTFLIHKSEEDIAEIIGISRTHLQKIKKSCIVKMWVDLKQYCEEND